MILSSLSIIVLLVFNMAFIDRANAQFYVDIEHSMPRLGKRTNEQQAAEPIMQQQQQQQLEANEEDVQKAPLNEVPEIEDNTLALLRELLTAASVAPAPRRHYYPHHVWYLKNNRKDDDLSMALRLAKLLNKKRHYDIIGNI